MVHGDFKLANKSKVLDGDVEFYDLVGSSDEIKKKFLPGSGDNFASSI